MWVCVSLASDGAVPRPALNDPSLSSVPVTAPSVLDLHTQAASWLRGAKGHMEPPPQLAVRGSRLSRALPEL